MASTLVPVNFFDPATVRESLAEVAEIADSDKVSYVSIPQYDAVLIYSVSGEGNGPLPEIFHILKDLGECPDYNKIVASFKNGVLSLGIAQGAALLLANEYAAPDFTTAQYFIFLALHSLQLNPEVSVIRFREGLSKEEEMSLYRYFKSVEII